MEDLADLDAAAQQIGTRSLDVRDDEVHVLGRSGRGGRHLCPELDRAGGPGRRELDDPEAVVEREVGIEPPAETRVELLRAIDVGDRDDDDLELQVTNRHEHILSLRRPSCDEGDHMSATAQPVSFDSDIKPLFRERDRGAMKFFVDLWSYDDVAREGDAILERLSDGSMPCDGAWDGERIALFQRWIEGGKAA